MFAVAAPAAIAFTQVFAGESVTHEVRIIKFKFKPETLTAKPGDRITFINDDVAPHTATARDKSWDTGKLKKGESATLEVTKDFSAEYFCRFHPQMKGRVKITDAG